ncbi:hypothetical protein PINS_up021718 [Pythium insidiosum]|nr:hypothetical protein PINS_up021718 [Pythium insidiosum]
MNAPPMRMPSCPLPSLLHPTTTLPGFSSLSKPFALPPHTTESPRSIMDHHVTAAPSIPQSAIAQAPRKCSLAFILSDAPAGEGSCSGSETESEAEYSSRQAIAPARRRRAASHFPERASSDLDQQPLGSPEKKGSKYCIVEGCTSRAKHARRCWRHGGSVKCKVADCINRAKSKGVCWSHGGGTLCSHPNCETIAVSHGFCWAHGGGKRCLVDNCSRPAYERTQNYCTTHYKQRNRKAGAAALHH